MRKYLLGERDEKVSGSLGSDPDTKTNAKTRAQRAVDVAAYCLMPNHYHLLVRINANDFSQRMKHLAQAYVEAFNRRLDRSGYLFEARFQAKLIDDETYLWHLSRYIHRNPVEARLVTHPRDWEYSSYREYSGERAGLLPSPDLVLRDFHSRAQYRQFVEGGAVDPAELQRFTLEE